MQQMDSSLRVTPLFFAMPCWWTWHLTGTVPSLSTNANCVGKCGVLVLIFECMVKSEGGCEIESVNAKMFVFGVDMWLFGSSQFVSVYSVHWHGVQ
jgi:hypothetical protein